MKSQYTMGGGWGAGERVQILTLYGQTRIKSKKKKTRQ